MNMKPTHRGSGSARPSGGAKPTRTSTSSPEPVLVLDDEVLTEAQTIALLKLDDHPNASDVVERIPHAFLGGEKRWIRSQVLTWAALGGERPRHAKRGAVG